MIRLEAEELPIVESPYFQRLRQIKQLGFAEYSFPGALHNRSIHSLGAMHTATQVFDQILRPHPQASSSRIPHVTLERWRSVVRLAALLHDIGHGPLSHTTEFAMPTVEALALPALVPVPHPQRKATHEDYTLKMILDSGLTPLLKKAGSSLGFKPEHIASLIEPQLELKDDFFIEQISSLGSAAQESVDFRPLLQQLISSELDADRMDYLRRDSLYAGVSYGQFDFNWLLGNLTYHIHERKSFLCLEHRALYAFEDFLISRFHMFLMVYFHHKTVIFDEMLAQYLGSPECDYHLPSDIEAYCQYDDQQLYHHLSQSKNSWAQRITQNRPYRMLIELHSGIPAQTSNRAEQNRILQQLENELSHKQIPALRIHSTSELSKYFRRPGDPIFVRYDNHYHPASHIPLEQCTDLFQKYGENRTISRLYVAPEDEPRCRTRHSPEAGSKQEEST